MKNQPIIIIGMHRSGTSMLTRFISDLGVFMGKDKSENDESEFFQNLNRWLLFQSGSSWDLPYPIDLVDSNFIDLSVDIIKKRISSIWCYSFFGLKNYIAYREIPNISKIWGWKDPRNTLLLPFYKKVFPEAKIIHIYRNPIDVSLSLQTRETHNKKMKQEDGFKFKIKKEFLIYQRILKHSFLVEDLQKCVDLWEFYTKKALESDKLFNNTLHIKYEDFLKSPEQILYQVSKFIDIEPNRDLINSVSKKTNPDRAYSFLNNEQYRQFYDKMKNRPLMKTLGYDNII